PRHRRRLALFRRRGAALGPSRHGDRAAAGDPRARRSVADLELLIPSPQPSYPRSIPMADYSTQMALLASLPTPQTTKRSSNGSGTFFEAMAQAWGDALDRQANLIVQKSDALTAGDDSPGAVTALTTESMKLNYLSNSAHTSTESVGQSLETMARKG